MADSRQISRIGAVNDDAPYIFHTEPVPIDLYSEGPAGPTWYRIPSWRIEFTCEALKGVDCRVHRGLGHEGQWTLSEASTGFKMFDDHGTAEGMLAEFAASTMLKLTPELVAKSIAKAKEILKGKIPSPFAPSEKSPTEAPSLPFYQQVARQRGDAAALAQAADDVDKARKASSETQTTDEAFHAGTLAALDVVYLHDQEVVAAEIVNATDHEALLRWAVKDGYHNLAALKKTIRSQHAARR